MLLRDHLRLPRRPTVEATTADLRDVHAALVADAPGGGWVRDGMAGFERLTLGLDADRQVQNIVTLVRRRIPEDRRDPDRRPVLAIHGWSDYFYNAPLAEAFEDAGYAFHAVDLRHYGRSLRPGQTPGWTDDLRRYDADIEAALAAVARDHPLPPVVLGHSTGGLVASLWADRNPGRLAALVLNSPWLQTHGGTTARAVARLATRPLARARPYGTLSLPRVDFYWRSLSSEADGEWDLVPAWRTRWSFDLPHAWLDAVLAGHARVARGLSIDVPVLVLVSDTGHRGLRYGEAMLAADIILNPSAMARRALRLGREVTVQQHAGALHDIYASSEPVRSRAMADTLRWLAPVAPPREE